MQDRRVILRLCDFMFPGYDVTKNVIKNIIIREEIDVRSPVQNIELSPIRIAQIIDNSQVGKLYAALRKTILKNCAITTRDYVEDILKMTPTVSLAEVVELVHEKIKFEAAAAVYATD